jgi:flavodoxin
MEFLKFSYRHTEICEKIGNFIDFIAKYSRKASKTLETAKYFNSDFFEFTAD